MNNQLVDEITESQLRKDLPDFKSGDEIKVNVKIIEGNKRRIQTFQGVVIQVRGSKVSKTFTVRKVSSGVGVERTFNYNSPSIDSIEVVKRGKVRRNKLYYLRGRSGKSARIKQKL
ncbi:MAG: 50S ribosomal protein L19 [Coprobacillus sp.]|nr:50S ribosomal protein L19 [Coprobacillus sp.]